MTDMGRLRTGPGWARYYFDDGTYMEGTEAAFCRYGWRHNYDHNGTGSSETGAEMGREAEANRKSTARRATFEAACARDALDAHGGTILEEFRYCAACKIVYHPGTDDRCPFCGDTGFDVAAGRFRTKSNRPPQPEHQCPPWTAWPAIPPPPPVRTVPVNMPIPNMGVTIATLDTLGNVTIKVDQPSHSGGRIGTGDARETE